MKIEIINTGTELLLGRVLNTHQQWLCGQLASRGWVPHRQVTVDDSAPAIRAAVKEALTRSQVIVVTGGLGPTSDDLTRSCISDLLERELVLQEEILNQIRLFYESRGRKMPESTCVQAYAPRGSIVLPNANGTAPGLVIEIGNGSPMTSGTKRLLIMLPGPPRELYPMFTHQVVPLITNFITDAPQRVQRILRTTGLGESIIEDRIASNLKPMVEKGLELGYCARIGEVEIRLAACGNDAFKLVIQAEDVVRSCLGDAIFTTDESSFESIVVQRLTQKKQTLVTAESCTGGFLAHRITNVPGSSEIFLNGWITYSNRSKQELLGVPAHLIDQFGAVSEPTARAMAEGARLRAQSNYAISITGIAGPGGGTVAKPVGTVFIALASEKVTRVQHFLNALDRESFKQATAQQALDMLRRELLASH